MVEQLAKVKITKIKSTIHRLKLIVKKFGDHSGFESDCIQIITRGFANSC